MAGETVKFVAAMTSMFLLLSCSDKRAEAGITGPNAITAITWSVGTVEPVFFTRITVDQSDRARLYMKNAEGPLPVREVRSQGGSFESIAMDLALFRPPSGHLQSDCSGNSDSSAVTVSWRYKDGHESSYSVMPGCSRQDEQRFLDAATSIASRVGLRSWIDRAPTPQ